MVEIGTRKVKANPKCFEDYVLLMLSDVEKSETRDKRHVRGCKLPKKLIDSRTIASVNTAKFSNQTVINCKINTLLI